MTDVTIAAVNAMTDRGFVERFGDVYEHSAWVAERAASARPFGDLAALRAEMERIVRHAGEEAQTTLLRAHPQLAGKEAKSGSLTASSSSEQAGAGLVDLSHREMETVERFNSAYLDKFGFPFIIAVRNHDKSSIMAAMEHRLENDRETEWDTALEQVFEIARLRLETLFSGAAGQS